MALDQELGREVALKVPHPGTLDNPRLAERFLREARAAAAVRDEHVVGVHAVDEQPVPYLVMEYVAGRSLQERLDDGGPLPVPEVLRIGRQVAAGLALTIFGVGLSGLIGAGFVGERIEAAPHLYIPFLTDIPVIGKIVFGEDAFVYTSIALVVGIWWFLYRTRAGLVLRAVGDNHASAHALGYPVLKIRMLAVLFGGACAGLAGAFLSLSYTPFFVPGMTAGRGWIALALVVFASWRPGRLVVGAYLFGAVSILGLALQPLQLGVPQQLMNALPYLATVIVLVLISRTRGVAGSAAPASLGVVFVPDR